MEPPKVLQLKPLEAARIQRALPGVPRVQAHAIRIEGPSAGIEKKLDQINGRLEKIEKALEKLLDD